MAELKSGGTARAIVKDMPRDKEAQAGAIFKCSLFFPHCSSEHTFTSRRTLYSYTRAAHGPNLAEIFSSSLTAGDSRQDHGNHRPAETSTCPEHWHSSQQGGRVTGTRSCAFMQMGFWLCQHTLWNTLPQVRCICNEV